MGNSRWERIIYFPILYYLILPLIGVPLLRRAPLPQGSAQQIGRQEAGVRQ